VLDGSPPGIGDLSPGVLWVRVGKPADDCLSKKYMYRATREEMWAQSIVDVQIADRERTDAHTALESIDGVNVKEMQRAPHRPCRC
jgi:hypothetical protein